MNTLIRTEWLKMKKYNAFWWIIGITILSYPAINYMFYRVYLSFTGESNKYGQYIKMAIGNPFAFPETWHTVAYFSSVFIFIPAVMVIMLICNEYTYRTHRQNIIDGWSRKQFITSKLVDVLIISLIITVVYAIVAFIMGINNQDRLITHTWDQVQYIGLFALQTFAQLSIAFLLGFLIRKAFLAMGIYIFYSLVVENILVGYLSYKKSPATHYFPFEISDRMVPPPAFFSRTFDPVAYEAQLSSIPKFIALTVLLTAAIWFICYRINSRRDLK
jgi:ABC-2 type transport system permease protein